MSDELAEARAHVARLAAALEEAAASACRHCRNEDGMLKAARPSKQPGRWWHDWARVEGPGGFWCEATSQRAALVATPASSLAYVRALEAAVEFLGEKRGAIKFPGDCQACTVLAAVEAARREAGR